MPRLRTKHPYTVKKGKKRTTFSGKNVVHKKGEVSYLTLMIITFFPVFPMEIFKKIMYFYVFIVEFHVFFYTLPVIFTSPS